MRLQKYFSCLDNIMFSKRIRIPAGAGVTEIGLSQKAFLEKSKALGLFYLCTDFTNGEFLLKFSGLT